MPNWCNLDIYITAQTPDDAKKIYQGLQESHEKAQKEKVAMFVGSTAKYLFWSDFDLVDDSIYLHGDVKWSLEHSEAIEWIQWLKSHGKIIEAKIQYQECGSCAYGQYYFDGTLLYDEYLPWKYFPKYDESDPDSWDDLLKTAFDEHGIDIVVTQFAA